MHIWKRIPRTTEDKIMAIKKPIFKCQCGCDEDIPYSPRHEYPSKKPTYKVGHAHRNKFHLNRQTIEKEYLEAGSGVKLAKKYGISPVAVYNMLGKLNVNLIPKEELEEGKQKLGREWEIECLRQLERSKDFSGDNWRCAFDISWNDFKINIKASKPVRAGKQKNKIAWSFNTKKHEGVDYFLCIGLDEEGEFEKMFMIPVNEVKKQTTIRRNGNTKHEKYRTTFEELNHKRQDEGY